MSSHAADDTDGGRTRARRRAETRFPALERYRHNPIWPAPDPRSELFEQLYQWWSKKG
ncbi:MAG: hypothetical protein ABSD48_16495 [Armatimonadota bacterium]|jgi:hypothetical protein